jgi:hypothetical protein
MSRNHVLISCTERCMSYRRQSGRFECSLRTRKQNSSTKSCMRTLEAPSRDPLPLDSASLSQQDHIQFQSEDLKVWCILTKSLHRNLCVLHNFIYRRRKGEYHPHSHCDTIYILSTETWWHVIARAATLQSVCVRTCTGHPYLRIVRTHNSLPTFSSFFTRSGCFEGRSKA